MCDSIGGCMKKLVSRVVLALFVANVASTSMAVESSWLSKAWQRLETSLEKASQEATADRQRAADIRALPKYTDADYEYIRIGKNRLRFGKVLPNSEFTVAGVSIGAHVNAVIKSLGKPTSEDIQYEKGPYRNSIPVYTLQYGGVIYKTQYKFVYAPISSAERISKITIHNRDATTARGITVGDTLKQVYNAYGRPTFVTKKNEWFYGMEYEEGSDGIWFVNDGYTVTKIKLGDAGFEYGRSKDTF